MINQPAETSKEPQLRKVKALLMHVAKEAGDLGLPSSFSDWAQLVAVTGYLVGLMNDTPITSD